VSAQKLFRSGLDFSIIFCDGGMKIDQAKRYKELEQENARLKSLVADLSLDNAMIKEISKGNF
jgi:cell division protein FtsB